MSEPLRVPALPGRNCCGRCRHFRCDIQTADGTPLAEFGCCIHPESIAQDPLLMVDDWCSLFAARDEASEEVRHE